jgi:hypothetical protein
VYSWHVQHRPQRIASHEKEKGQHRGSPSQTECQLRAGLHFYSTTPIETGTRFPASIRHQQETHTSFFLRHLARETVSSRSAPQTLSHCLPIPSSQPLPPEARTTGSTISQFDIYSQFQFPVSNQNLISKRQTATTMRAWQPPDQRPTIRPFRPSFDGHKRRSKPDAPSRGWTAFC